MQHTKQKPEDYNPLSSHFFGFCCKIKVQRDQKNMSKRSTLEVQNFKRQLGIKQSQYVLKYFCFKHNGSVF